MMMVPSARMHISSRARHLDVGELGEHQVGRGGVQRGQLLVQVGQTHQGAQQDLRLHPGGLWTGTRGPSVTLQH